MNNKVFNTQSAPHIPHTNTVKKVMLLVWLALVPAILAHIYFFGTGIIIQLTISIFALLISVKTAAPKLIMVDCTSCGMTFISS